MKLYLIYPTMFARTSGFFNGPGCLNRIVVRARDESEARTLATENTGYVPGSFWLDTDYSTCEELKVEGKIGPICVDRWGE